MLALKVLLAIGLLLSQAVVRAEDAAEGEGAPIVDAGKEEDDSVRKIGPSPDALTSFHLVEPEDGQEIYAGKLVHFLVGFANKGEKDFIVHFLEPSFRYPMDYSYSMLNLTATRYERTVAPKQEITVDYRFIPNEAFIGRPAGFVVNLHYTDAAGGYYVSTVYNETITVQEHESAFNTETGFLLILFVGLVVLLLLVGQHYLSKFTRKSPAAYQPKYETGTNKDEVDYEWIPRYHLADKSPKSPKGGSRKRAAKTN